MCHVRPRVSSLVHDTTSHLRGDCPRHRWRLAQPPVPTSLLMLPLVFPALLGAELLSVLGMVHEMPADTFDGLEPFLVLVGVMTLIAIVTSVYIFRAAIARSMWCC